MISYIRYQKCECFVFKGRRHWTLCLEHPLPGGPALFLHPAEFLHEHLSNPNLHILISVFTSCYAPFTSSITLMLTLSPTHSQN
ncbi:hypothetical protein Avbf_02073 [Armadillidium vulgare]|nr:hypothetical protein Avbf_02073 [Armadillidium vulgare]